MSEPSSLIPGSLLISSRQFPISNVVKHRDYADYIRSRGDLGPDQKQILIKDDLDRRKNANSSQEDTSEGKPTLDEFEAIERLEYGETEWVAGKFEETFWAIRADSADRESGSVDNWNWMGPEDSLDKIVEHIKDFHDTWEKIWEEDSEYIGGDPEE